MLFSLRPAVYTAWRELVKSIRGTIRLRQYELVTLGAARALGCRACVSAHGNVLLRNGIVDRPQLEALVRDVHAAGLEPLEVAMMELGEKVAVDAGAVTLEDITALRAFGLTDAAILDVVLVAAARSFYSKTLDALGVPPSPELAGTNDLLDLVATPARATAPTAEAVLGAAGPRC
jgi:uncharacterized peroxidase-related enzyme